MLNEPTACAIFEAAHAAWSGQDLDGMLAWYHDDLTYFCNTGASDLGPMHISGKAQLKAFLQPILDVAESVTVPISFSVCNGVGRAQVEGLLKHRKTGNLLTAQYRQVVTFDGNRIMRHEEFHDAAKMRAFWRMVKRDEYAKA